MARRPAFRPVLILLVGVLALLALPRARGGGLFTASTATTTPAPPAPAATQPSSPATPPSPAPATPAGGATLYVATAGADSNPGTLAAPLRTIMQAQRLAEPGTSIVVRGGVYNEGVVFDHGGLPGRPITLQAYPGETPVLDGSMEVADWTPLGNGVWRAAFTHPRAIATSHGPKDSAAEATCPDGYAYSGDRRAYLYVDDTPDAQHWLKPLCLRHDPGITSPADLPAGSFASDAPPPPLPAGQAYAGRTDTLYVHLPDGGDPNAHRIRVAAYDQGILFWGDGVGHITVRGLTLRLGLAAVYEWSPTSDITLDGLDVSLVKEIAINTTFCSTGYTVVNSRLYDIEYEGIHLEADDSRVEGNTIERTLAPWSRYASIGVNVLGNNNRVAGNTIRGLAKTQAGHGGTGLFLEEWYDGGGDVGCHAETAQGNVVERNRIYDNAGTGLYDSGGDANTVRNNLVYGNGGDGITIEAGGTDGGPTGAQRNADHNTIDNNTIYGNSGRGIVLSAWARDTVVRNNISDNNSGQPLSDASSGAALRANMIAGDPGFVDAAGGDFHLREGSPAIDAGLDLRGAGVAEDFAGTPRPQGAGYDLGAYEYRGP